MNQADTETTEQAELIERFSEAWAARDIETLMELVTDDCVFRASLGPEPGATFTGRDEVRRGFAQLLATGIDDPAPETETEVPLISRDFAVTRWTSRFPAKDGPQVVVRACDIIEFDGGLIKFKDAYRKVHS